MIRFSVDLVHCDDLPSVGSFSMEFFPADGSNHVAFPEIPLPNPEPFLERSPLVELFQFSLAEQGGVANTVGVEF